MNIETYDYHSKYNDVIWNFIWNNYTFEEAVEQLNIVSEISHSMFPYAEPDGDLEYAFSHYYEELSDAKKDGGKDWINRSHES